MSLLPEHEGKVESFLTTADLTTKLGFFTKPGSTAGEVDVATVAGSRSFGPIVTPSSAGRPVSVMREGKTYTAAASAAYTFDQELAVNASGELVAAAAGDYVVALSREGKTTTGEALMVEVVRPNYQLNP